MSLNEVIIPSNQQAEWSNAYFNTVNTNALLPSKGTLTQSAPNASMTLNASAGVITTASYTINAGVGGFALGAFFNSYIKSDSVILITGSRADTSYQILCAPFGVEDGVCALYITNPSNTNFVGVPFTLYFAIL